MNPPARSLKTQGRRGLCEEIVTPFAVNRKEQRLTAWRVKATGDDEHLGGTMKRACGFLLRGKMLGEMPPTFQQGF
jgi:hypothetical protein